VQLVHDTFHHHLAGEDAFFAAATGLVHVSGVDAADIAVDTLRDPHRVLVGPRDRLANVAQLRTLLDAGYSGVVSFEPFADAVMAADDIEQQLAASMAYLSAAVAASTGTEVNSVR
jgi:2-keto-myo-inositol isomerase